MQLIKKEAEVEGKKRDKVEPIVKSVVEPAGSKA